MDKNILYVEKYRPQVIDECILPEHLKKVFKEFTGQGKMPNLLLSGGAGIGKTTVARALCNELGYDETMHNVTRAILQRGTIIYQRIEDAATGRFDICMERSGWTATTLQTAIRALGTSVGVNNKDVSLSTVTETELKLDNS